MAKIPFQDVVPPERRSIRDIPIPQGGKRRSPVIITPKKATKPKMESVEVKITPEKERADISARISEITQKGNPNINTEEPSESYKYYSPQLQKDEKEFDKKIKIVKPKKRKFVFGLITLIVIGAFVVGMMTVFSSATILVAPKSQDVEVSSSIVGALEASTSTVRYEIIKLSKSKTVSVPATSEEEAEVKAHGKLVIYNNFSFEPQRLIIRTRFESPDGFIYRIPESVTVPGKFMKDGVETPGSIEVEVFADEAGEKYNIKKSDFTIPGFKSEPLRYKNFYARGSTDMTGGFIGKRKTVGGAEKEAALTTIQSDVQALIEKDLRSKIPDGLSLLQNSIIYESSELPQKEESSSVVLGYEVTAYAIMLNTEDLSNKIIEEYLDGAPGWNNIKAVIKDFSNLNMTKKPSKVGNLSGLGERVDLGLSGKVQILADVDTDVISQRLAGIPRKETAKLIDEFPGISSITATIRPIWKQSFPADPSKINVKTGTSQ